MMSKKIWKMVMIALINLCFLNYAHAKVFILIGPSGAGKSTLINKFLSSEFKADELISYTTRPMRTYEKNMKDYFFVSVDEYKRREKNNEFILSTVVHGNWYGIPRQYIDEALRADRNLIVSLNTEAAKKLKALLGTSVVTIFVTPSCFDELKTRLTKRGQEKVSLDVRLKNAKQELNEQDSFDYKIINDNIDGALSHLKKIFFSQASLKLNVKQLVLPVKDPKSIRAMSYNIRMAPCAEDANTENSWDYRLPKVNMILNKYTPDIIGIQEVSSIQMRSLEESDYHVRYKFVGKYPTKEPIESGLGIIYNSEKLILLSKLHITWLNESQVKSGGPAWDGSSYERYVIYAKFKNIATGNDFWFMTTHFDHLGTKARQESAKIVMGIAEKLDAPTLITGDFNCFPQAGGQELYQTLSCGFETIKDSGKIAGSVFGVPGSWIGWDYDIYKQRKGYAKYDFIFVKGISKVLQHGIIDDQVWDSSFQKELYPSDHRPVLSDLDI